MGSVFPVILARPTGGQRFVVPVNGLIRRQTFRLHAVAAGYDAFLQCQIRAVGSLNIKIKSGFSRKKDTCRQKQHHDTYNKYTLFFQKIGI